MATNVFVYYYAIFQGKFGLNQKNSGFDECLIFFDEIWVASVRFVRFL